MGTNHLKLSFNLMSLIMDLKSIFQIAISVTGIINTFLVALFLFFGAKGNVKANKILSFLLLAVCLKMSFALLINFPHTWGVASLLLYYLSEGGYFAFGPLLLWYYRVMLKKPTSPIYATFIFVPVLYPFVGHFLSYDIPLWQMQLYFLVFLMVIYIDLFKFLKGNTNNQLQIADKFWLKVLIGCFTFIWLFVNVLFIDFKYYIIELSIIFTIVFYLLVYLVIKHYWLRKGDIQDARKYANSKLTLEEEHDILLRLQHMMQHEKLYTDPEVTLSKVATVLKVRPHKLSQVINQKLDMTFNEYINSCRINEIKTIIKQPEHQTSKIATIAYDYGFNSISAFNTAFKKFTNYTPSEYKNLMHNLN